MKRTILVKTTIEWVTEVPDDWDIGLIDFHFNESSHCCDNDIKDISDMADRLEKNMQCTCSLVETEYIREATEDDEERCAWGKSE